MHNQHDLDLPPDLEEELAARLDAYIDRLLSGEDLDTGNGVDDDALPPELAELVLMAGLLSGGARELPEPRWQNDRRVWNTVNSQRGRVRHVLFNRLPVDLPSLGTAPKVCT